MSVQQSFQHRGRETGGCSCPIHRGRDREPFTAPLGLPFADHVSARPIGRTRATAIYDAHHGYMSDVPRVNLVHHGIAYQRAIVGAVTYRYPLLSRKRLHLDAADRPVPQPRTPERVRRALPEALHGTALRVLDLARVDAADVAETTVVRGDRFVEAARICLGVRMPNLASAGLARSQERFVRDHVATGDELVDYLLTFVRADYDATMIRALRDKGWRCVGWTEPRQAGNREDKGIRERYKWQFLCDVRDAAADQATLRGWAE